MLDVVLLQEEMKAYGDSITSLADALGVSRQNVSQVLHGVHDFTYPQMCVIVHRYCLTADQVYDIFFMKKEGDVLPP